MIKEEKYWIGALILGSIVGCLITHRKAPLSGFDGGQLNYFDGDENNSYASGTAETTETSISDKPIHYGEGVYDKTNGDQLNPKRKLNKVTAFWHAYHNVGSPAHDKMIQEIFMAGNPGKKGASQDEMDEYFDQREEIIEPAMKRSWAVAHNIRDPKKAESFWTNSTKSGSRDQMEHMYRAFNPRINSIKNSNI